MKKIYTLILCLFVFLVCGCTIDLGSLKPTTKQLDTPVVTISKTGLASWSAIVGASEYCYKINDGADVYTPLLYVQLELGDSISVIAVGDGVIYKNSKSSEIKTYTATEIPTTPENPPTEPGEINPDSMGAKILAEYNDLVSGVTTTHTTWTFSGVVLDMSATKFNSSYNNYNVKLILDVDGVLVGIYNGFVDGSYPTSIEGLEVGKVVEVVGVIAEKYTLTSGPYTANIEFSNPDISWEDKVTEEPSVSANSVNFLMINDTHGAFTDSAEGYSIGRVDSLKDSLEEKKGDYILIHNGDAFQGSYVSGETFGRPLIEAFNEMEFDAFVLGNHEFDWGLDKIKAYADGSLANGEATFPFLGANIYFKGTKTNPDWVDPYTVVEYGDLKVGIIGIMGYGQESSILTRYVEDYEFASPLSIIKENAKYLRTTEGCDVVVVAAHDYDSSLNNGIAALSGDSIIDAIFCAHTHQLVNEKIKRSDNLYIPVVQNYHKNNRAAEVNILVDDEGKMTGFNTTSHKPSNYEISDGVSKIINQYNDYILESEVVLGTTSNYLSEATLGYYALDAMLEWEYQESKFSGIDVAIINKGGVRANINSGEITKSEVFEVFPFNNMIVLVNIKGKYIKSLYSSNQNYLYIDVVDSIGNYQYLEDETVYQLAVIDYVFEGPYYTEFDHLKSDEYLQTDVIMRSILLEYIDEMYN